MLTSSLSAPINKYTITIGLEDTKNHTLPLRTGLSLMNVIVVECKYRKL